MPVTSNAKTKVSIGTNAPKADAAAYAADSWVLIGNVTDVGEAGPESEILTSKIVGGDGYVIKRKGSRDAGVVELTVERDSADVGYIALLAAEKSDAPFNFKVQVNDAPIVGVSPKPSVFYMSAVVASAKNNFGDADNIVSTVFSLAISGAIIEVLASAT